MFIVFLLVFMVLDELGNRILFVVFNLDNNIFEDFLYIDD